MKPKLLTLFVVLFLAAAALLVLIYGVWLVGRKGSPLVLINAPSTGDQLKVREPVLVQATASDDAGVDTLELWGDGVLLAVEKSSLPGGSRLLPLVDYWHPSAAGAHTLIARAITHDGRKGQTMVQVSVAEGLAATPGPYTVGEGETLAQIAEAFNLEPADLQGANPGLGDAPPAGSVISLPPPSDSEADRPEGAPLTSDYAPPDPLEPMLRAPLVELFKPVSMRYAGRTLGRPIGLTELSLEVDRSYEGVYCYAALGDGAFDRIPADGFLTHSDGLRWAPAEGDWPAGIAPAGGGALRVQLNCLGYVGSPTGGVVYDLGTIDVSHPRAEWDGRPLAQEAVGPGGSFRLTYAIKGGGAPVPTPMGADPALIADGGCGLGEGFYEGRVVCRLEWAFEGDVIPDWVRGYRVFRNGALYTTILSPETMDLSLYDGAREVPLCGTQDEFYVVAYGDGGWLLASNTVLLSDPVCGERSRQAAVFLENLMPICLRAETVDIGLHTWGLGAPRDAEGNLIWEDPCSDPSNPDSWPEMVDWCRAYGSIAVNGMRIHSWCDGLNSGTLYRLPGRGFGFLLEPDETLTISLNYYDSDLSSSDDQLCGGQEVYPRETLDAVMALPDRRHEFEAAFPAEYGTCLLRFILEVLPPEEAAQPPAPIIIP
jgi:LysM repeat protein